MGEGENPIIAADGTGPWKPLNIESPQSGGGMLNDVTEGWGPLGHEGQHGEPSFRDIIESTLEQHPNVRGLNAVRERVAEALINAAKAENPHDEVVDVLKNTLQGLAATGSALRSGVSLEPYMTYHDHVTGMLVRAITASKR